MKMSRLGRGAVAACLLAATSPAAAETFILTNGDVVEGTVVRALGKTLSIKYPGAGMLQVPIRDVQRVEIATKDGGVISARIISWSEGVYQLSTDEGPLQATVEGGQAVSVISGVGDDTERQDRAEIAASPAPAPTADPASPDFQTINAGFVYAGPADDGGRIFMRERGRQELAEHPLVDATAYREIASENKDRVTNAVDQLVAGGANLVFMTGHDSAAATTESAARHADVRFVHCGDFDPSSNVDVVCGRIYQARYLTGMIAGGMTKANLIGYVAARPTPETVVDINAFALGVQSVNPEAKVMVNWTNAWYAPAVAQRRARELIGRGVDVLTIHQDTPAALQVAEQHGVDAIGFQSDMNAFAPSSILTSAVWNWGEIYYQFIERLNSGEARPHPTWLGLREGAVGLAPISERVPEDLKRLVEFRRSEMVAGRFHVFNGPIRDVDGDVRILDGRAMTDDQLQTMDYLVEGVVGY